VTQEHVQIVRRVYEHWAEGDFRAGIELYDPHVVFIQRPEFPHAGVYLGPEQLSGYMRELLEAWDDFTIAAEEILPAGDSLVVAVLQRGIGVGSGAVTELRYFHVWTFRGSTVVRWENFRERSEALAAVGLQE
jgi:ketosteroid isomerase-like protein